MAKNGLSSFFRLIEENQRSIALLLLLLTATGVIAAYRYYKFTQEDPQFCTSCHLMQEAFRSWEMSKHRDYPCQKCHRMSLLEQNRMLIAFVVNEGKSSASVRQQHGRISPWNACKKCHLPDVEQGSLTLTNSYGHARHVFMLKINCSKCHTGTQHAFTPNERACSECHKDKVIHGMGMSGLSCLQCHSYGEKAPKMISTERCLRCHKNFPTKGTMSSLKCFDCHHPHGQLKLTNSDCLKQCHGSEARVGQHNLHMTKAKLNCLDCHKPHTWYIGKKEAKGLCDRCHPMRDPATFIY